MDPTQPVQINNQPNIVPNSVIPPQPQKSSLNIIFLTLMVILTIVALIIGGYIFFSINQKKTLPSTTSNISPTTNMKEDIVITPSAAVVESSNPSDIDIGSVEADLKDIETDIKGL
ncbi:hypothetical protein COS77_00545 [Candidatus Roizmanbacteria bacterium CG06_land_8_20_14_3_00_34_14]|uniref:Uncharacterized protein n=2 Tax=Candidatus Roizmaniibacteriota TaxID=1752723 RepID=A0A2M7AVF9_9BACT|nr:MAG: hypothetical protein COT02_00415 [Candidatus Roizmanbacteria bacterium CG07_land_8_20_14_0_80_34_15]PIU74625.1 MAG: hypothetical protein COS77_00545 [Candidatus Roizmanbacteria bacterium CG06_land_8_20_14_3_00_34_14]